MIKFEDGGKAKVVAEFADMVAKLEAAIDPADKAYILAYDNGLCIGFASGVPFACGFFRAEVIGNEGQPEEAWAYSPIVKNGAGEQAKVIARQAYLAREIPVIKGLLALAEEA